MRQIRTVLFFCIACAAILSFFPVGFKYGVAQSDTAAINWGFPQLVYETTGDISDPSLVADEFGRLHLLFSQSPHPFGTGQGDYAIYYTQLIEGSWQDPIDILVDRFLNIASSSNLAVLPDGSGVISYQGYPGQPNLSISENSNGHFNQVHSWRLPDAVTSSAVTCHSLSTGWNGLLYLVFGSVGIDNALNFTIKRESSWMEPVSLIRLSSNESVLSTDIVVDDVGQLHVFWTSTKYPSGYPPIATYYIRSHDEGITWSTPIEIAGRDIALAGAAISIPHIHVLLTGVAGAPGRYDVRSDDMGEYWYSPVLIDRVGAGLSGGNIVVDSFGGFHAAFGSATNSQVVVTHWDGSGWIAPKNIEQEIQPTLEDIDLAVVNGNQLVVVFVQGHYRLWAVHGLIQDAPPREPMKLPVQSESIATNITGAVESSEVPWEKPNLEMATAPAVENAVVFPMIAVWLPIGIILLAMIIKKFNWRK